MRLSENSLSKAKISVSIVFYNSTEKEINKALNNIKKMSTISEFSFIFFLIDNASTKKIKIKKGQMDNIYIKYLHINNGFGAGHNSILKDLNSDYHIVMNPDISIDDLTGFSEAVNYMQNHKDVVMLSPLVRNESDGQIQYLNRKEPTVFDLLIRFLGPKYFPKRQNDFVKKENGYSHIQADENATGAFMIMKTEDFKAIDGFDTRFFMYFEDTDLTKRISKRGRVIFYPYFTVIHGWKRENHSIKGIKFMIKSMILYFNKWGWNLY